MILDSAAELAKNKLKGSDLDMASLPASWSSKFQ
jgi:hypothetical protein